MGILSQWTRKKEKEERKDQAPVDATQDAALKPTSSIQAPVAATPAGAPQLLVRPYVSEKSLTQEGHGVYTFVVSASATKVAIKQEIKALYGITPTGVRILNMEGKKKQFGRRRGRRSDWKKAVVTLPKGQSISIHEGV